MRRDVHSLFDLGYVTISPAMKFEVSRKIREEFENGRHYYALHGASVALPDDPKRMPDRAALSWHNEYLFKS
jgi:putative restriction endonuclease